MDIPERDYIHIGAVILFGALAHALTQWKMARDGEGDHDFTLIDFVILFIIAVFSGVVFGLVSMMLNFGQVETILSSAIGAFLGIVGLDKVANMVLDFILSKKMGKGGQRN